MNKTKKFLTLLLCAVMVFGLVPFTAQEAQAAGIQTNIPTLTVNQSVVAFAGHEWWVIGMPDGTSGKGVNPVEGTVTLLAKNNDFGNSAFRKGDPNKLNGVDSKQYGDGWWYATPWMNVPNEYAGSTLQKKLESITNDQTDPHFISNRESALITKRTINNVDGINGAAVGDQKLWALSESEWGTINKIENGTSVLKYGTWWWLRSPDPDYGSDVARRGRDDGGSMGHGYVYDANHAVRPALNLNLTSVLFTSAAVGGKSSADVGSGLVSASAPADTVKFTIKDTANQKLTVEATQAQKTQSDKSSLDFIYSGATYGENQNISCVLTDSTGGADAVKYYGKLKQVDSADKANGTMQIPLAGVDNGTYTLKIFSEQANEAKYTDFASEPVTMTVTVSDGKGTVTTYNGIDHTTHSYQYTSLSDTQHKGVCYCKDEKTENHTYVGGECTACHETDKNFKPSITAGANSTWYKGSKTGLSITSDATIAHFQKVQVDGQDVAKANYEVKEGSTIVTLKAAYLESLPTGKHRVSIVSLTGTAETSFTIAEKTGENTNTGDESNPALWIALMLLALAGAGGTALYTRRNKAK